MTDDQRELVLDEIEAFYKQNELQPGDVTAEDVAEKIGMCTATAHNLMRRLVAEGKFEALNLVVDGHKRRVWRKVMK